MEPNCKIASRAPARPRCPGSLSSRKARLPPLRIPLTYNGYGSQEDQVYTRQLSQGNTRSTEQPFRRSRYRTGSGKSRDRLRVCSNYYRHDKAAGQSITHRALVRRQENHHSRYMVSEFGCCWCRMPIRIRFRPRRFLYHNIST